MILFPTPERETKLVSIYASSDSMCTEENIPPESLQKRVAASEAPGFLLWMYTEPARAHRCKKPSGEQTSWHPANSRNDQRYLKVAANSQILGGKIKLIKSAYLMSLLPFEKEVASDELKNVISHLIICHEKAPQLHSSIEPIPKKAYYYQHRKKKGEAIKLDDIIYQSSFDPLGVVYRTPFSIHSSSSLLWEGLSRRARRRLLCKTTNGHLFLLLLYSSFTTASSCSIAIG